MVKYRRMADERQDAMPKHSGKKEYRKSAAGKTEDQKPLFETELEFTEDNYEKYVWEMIYKRQHRFNVLIVMTVVFVGIAAYYLMNRQPRAGYGFLMLAAGYVVFFLLFVRSHIKRLWKNSPKYHGTTMRYAFYEELFTAKTPYSSLEIPYRKVIRCVQTGEYIYLMTGKSQGFILEKSRMSESFQKFVLEKMAAER